MQNEQDVKEVKIEEIIDHAKSRGVILPKKQIDFMERGLESNKVEAEYLIRIVDKAADKLEKSGNRWLDKSSEAIAEEKGKNPDKNVVVAKYCDGSNNVKAIITECKVKNSEHPENIGKTIYSATRINKSLDKDKNDQYVQMGTNFKKESLKNAVTAFYTQKIIIDAKKEINEQKKDVWLDQGHKNPSKEKVMEPSID